MTNITYNPIRPESHPHQCTETRNNGKQHKRSKGIHIWYRDCESESGWPGFLPIVSWDLCMLHTYLRLTQRTSIPSISSMNLLLTETRASCGHAWNQSIAVQLTMAGNFRALTRSVWPTGEKQKTICRERGEGRTGQKQQRDVCARQYNEISMREGLRSDTVVSYSRPGHWCKAALTFRVALL